MFFDEYIAESYASKEGWDIGKIPEKRKEFGKWIMSWNAFFENYCVNATVELLAIDRLDEFKKNIIRLIIEVSLIIFTLFENYRKGKKTECPDVYNIACYYARIIEHNRIEANSFVESLLTNEAFGSGDFFVLCKSMDFECEMK